MKYIHILFVLILASIQCFSQTWELQTSIGKIEHLKYFTSDFGYILEDNGQVMRTENGGEEWEIQETGTNGVLNDIIFIDLDYGFIVGDSGKIAHTIDGGKTWSSQTWNSPIPGVDISFFDLYDVDFVDYNIGYISGSMSILLKTTDGGTTWTNIGGATIGSQDITSVYFHNNLNGFIGGNTFESTSDGGATWQLIDVNVSQIQFVDVNNGFALGYNSLYVTINGGTNWNKISNLPFAVESIHFADDKNGVCSSLYNEMYKTVDGGHTWTKAIYNITSNSIIGSISSATFRDLNNGIAVDGTGYLHYTSNGGASWVKHQLVGQLNSSCFIDGNLGYVGTESGTLLKTTDGGDNWSIQTFGNFNYSFQDVHFADSNNGIVVGGAGLILTTKDGGLKWTEISSGTTNKLNSISSKSNDTIYIVGDLGVILKSNDAGLSWNSQASSSTSSLNSVMFLNSDLGFAAGNDGVILKTDNGGSQWNKLNGASKSLHTVYFSDALNGRVCGEGDEILVTSDGGATWTYESSGFMAPCKSIYLESENSGFMGVSNQIFKINDDGLGWHKYFEAVKTVQSLSFISNNIGFAICSDQLEGYPSGGRKIYKINNANLQTSNSNSIDTIERAFTFIGPNPASYNLTISTTHTKSELVVTSITGHEIISVIINSPTTTVDVSSWTNGTYIVRIYDSAGTVLKSEKVIISH